ncbi:pantoate--beta-alanine ligase [Brevundimonas sp.]|uniref:pantoate--beta-alanine ligase n=1 Tax=Brevundimonas sp. TaxID=1871086 RepID=UPI0025DB6260|nr:pantoate--beta-alanine ligase [Brevundimonas sp.]
MKVLTTRAEVREARQAFGRLGFVPTMGYLHEGHLSLVRAARARMGAVAVSIFVNPTQFAPTDDLARYPRDLERDLALLKAAGCDLVFTPGVEEIYPAGFSTRVEVDGVTAPLEGAVRPGHFSGVATVVLKLFNIVRPDAAWFGQKDAQQCAVLRRMAADLDLPVEVIVAPTVREPDGLAMSSRNVYLAPPERAAAVVLIRALRAAEAAFETGERNADRLREVMSDVLAAEPLARPDYVSIANPDTLAELETVDARGALASLAVRIGSTRLIDNLLLGDAAQKWLR